MSIRAFLVSILTGLLLTVPGTAALAAHTSETAQESICDYLPWWPGC